MEDIINVILIEFFDEYTGLTSFTDFEKKYGITDSIDSIPDEAIKEYLDILEKDLEVQILRISAFICDILSDLVMIHICVDHKYYPEYMQCYVRAMLYPKYHSAFDNITFGVEFKSEDDKKKYYEKVMELLDANKLKQTILKLSKLKLRVLGMSTSNNKNSKEIEDYIEKLYNLDMIINIFEDLTDKIYHGYIHDLGFDTYDGSCW